MPRFNLTDPTPVLEMLVSTACLLLLMSLLVFSGNNIVMGVPFRDKQSTQGIELRVIGYWKMTTSKVCRWVYENKQSWGEARRQNNYKLNPCVLMRVEQQFLSLQWLHASYRWHWAGLPKLGLHWREWALSCWTAQYLFSIFSTHLEWGI